MAAAIRLSLRGSDKKERAGTAYFVQTYKLQIGQHTEIKLDH